MNRENLTLSLLSLVVVVVLVSATVAWFVGIRPALVKNLIFNVDDRGELYVWVKVEEDIDEKDMDNIMSILHTSQERYNASIIASNNPENTASGGNASSGNVNMATNGNLTATSGNAYLGFKDYNLPTDAELLEQNFLPLKNVGVDDNVKYTIDMNIVEQDNIEKNMLAPGAFGKVEFKILSMTDRTPSFNLSITPDMMKVNEAFSNNAKKLTEEDLLQLVKTHIKFYAADDEGKYSEVIPYYDENLADNSLNCLFGELETGVMKDVVIYWYWPYEYTDIPEYDFNNTESPVYEDYAEYRDVTLSKNEITELYDWNDTYIGNYVEGLRFHFQVKGNRK